METTEHANIDTGVRIRQLQAFQAVAQIGGVTSAARKLGISQPAVSRLIRSFEQAAGMELFTRKGGRVLPTAEARLLLIDAGRVLDMLSGFETLCAGLRDQTAGHLRIACLPGFATTHLPDVLADFLRTRQQVQVRSCQSKPA